METSRIVFVLPKKLFHEVLMYLKDNNNNNKNIYKAP